MRSPLTIPIVGTVVVLGLQIMWPLVDGASLALLTSAIVLTFAATSVSHAWITRGFRWAAQYFGTTLGFAFAVEAVGVNTGFPFTEYVYTDSLGPQLLGVLLIIPIAWTMTAYLALLIGRQLCGANGRIVASLIGAFAMTTWDLFLDPQMVGAGYWVWADPTHSLPGIEGIPTFNFFGWFAVSFFLMLLLNQLSNEAHTRDPNDLIPAALWTWTWIGGIIANLFFLDRIGVALVGGVAMGLVTVPYLVEVVRTQAVVRAQAQSVRES